MSQTINEPEYTGRSPESGLLARLREWTDVLPVLRLVRVARLAGSPVWLVLVGVVYFVWTLGVQLIGPDLPFFPVHGAEAVEAFAMTTTQPSDLMFPLSPPPSLDADLLVSIAQQYPAPYTQGKSWLLIGWTMFCWVPCSMVLARLGALLTAGRDLPRFGDTLQVMKQRCLGGWLVSSLPMLCTLPFLVLLWMFGLAMNWAGHPLWLHVVTVPLMLAPTVIIALLLVGAKASVPLAIAALAIEKEPDPLDSLSRGYEYTFRRLPQLVVLVVVAVVLVAVITLSWKAVAAVAMIVSLPIAGPDFVLSESLSAIPVIVGITMSWGMIGGVYLLIRQSASDQEVEDVWIPPSRSKPLNVPSVSKPSDSTAS